MAKHELKFEGNVGADPDFRYTQNGKELCSFSVGVDDSYKPKGSDDWKRQTIWFRVSCFGALAGLINDHVHKGQKVGVIGKLSHDDKGGPRIWVDKEGQARASFEVMAFKVIPEDELEETERPARQVDADPVASDDAPF